MPAQQRIALVTGAAGIGVGQAVARRLARDGAIVVVTDIHAARLRAVTDAIAADHPDATVVGYELDVGHLEQIDAVIADLDERFGPLTLLVNNAASYVPGTMFDQDPADWDRTLAVNVLGPWHLCRLAMLRMRHGGGVIVNIGSYAPTIGVEGSYGIQKGALASLTRACAREGGRHGIRAVTVSTGFIADSMWSRRRPDMSDSPFTTSLLGSHPVAAEIAAAVAFLASDEAAHITGETLTVASGAYMRP